MTLASQEVRGEVPKPTRITILGSYSGRNAGDAALLGSIMRTVSEQFHGRVAFHVPTTHPGFIRQHYAGLFPVTAVSAKPWNLSIRLLGVPTLRAIRRSDVVLITDGIIFDKRLLDPCFNHLIALVFLVPWIRLWHKKLVCYSVGIGPLETRLGRLCARWVLESCDLIIVREAESRQLLREIGVHQPVHLRADPALLAWPSSEGRVRAVLGSIGLSSAVKRTPLLGLNVTSYVDCWMPRSMRMKSRGAFLALLAEACVRLKRELEIEVVLVATHRMDAAYARQLQLACAARHRRVTGRTWAPALLTNHDHTHHDIVGVAARCDLFVGMRLHSLILAARAGTPIVGLVYAPKVRAFLGQVRTPDWALSLDAMTAEELCQRIAKAWRTRRSLRLIQQEAVHELQRLAVDAGRLLAERYGGAAFARHPAEGLWPRSRWSLRSREVLPAWGAADND